MTSMWSKLRRQVEEFFRGSREEEETREAESENEETREEETEEEETREEETEQEETEKLETEEEEYREQVPTAKEESREQIPTAKKENKGEEKEEEEHRHRVPAGEKEKKEEGTKKQEEPFSEEVERGFRRLAGLGRGTPVELVRENYRKMQGQAAIARPTFRAAESIQERMKRVQDRHRQEVEGAMAKWEPKRRSVIVPITKEEKRVKVRQQEREEWGCWRCHKTGHRYQDCQAPRKWEFCYRCGWPNHTVKTCPECSPRWKKY